MSVQKRRVPSDDYATIVTGEVTVVLSTSDEPFPIDEDFAFETKVCLIYAEKIHVKTPTKQPSKRIGLFCSEIEVKEKAVIDVSGEHGKNGTNSASDNGEKGGPGNAGGQVWLFVQNATAEMLKNLTIKAAGGDGGTGGDAGALKKIGGRGGNGGNGGSIEVLFGTTTKKIALALGSLLKRSWPEQTLNLIKDVSHLKVPDELNAEQKHIVDQYGKLKQGIERVAISLEAFGSIESAVNVKEMIRAHLKAAQSPEFHKNGGFNVSITRLTEAAKALSQLASQDGSSSAVSTELKNVTAIMDSLKPQEESELAGILYEIAARFAGTVGELERHIRDQCRNIYPGAGGQGGNSGSARDKPGPAGEKGISGFIKAVNMRLNGSKSDLEATQPFAFPDQCQMLLNKADRAFFSNKIEENEKAAVLYRRLVRRLSFVGKLDWAKKDSSKLAAAYTKMQDEWKVTMLMQVQLQSIHQQAESRLNRLTLGQDMWGHREDWAPRLSVQFYEEEILVNLDLLKTAEKVTKDYEDALQGNRDTEVHVKEGISSMRSNKDAATAMIKFLTGENGPLKMAIYKIDALTPEIKAKRQKIHMEIAKIEIRPSLDTSTILSALTTLVSTKPNLESLMKLAGAGYDLYKSSTMAKDMKGNTVRKEYIIDQLTTCGDTLDSLKEAFSTRKDNTIAVDDPACVKILTAVENIETIVREFKDAIPNREELHKMLIEYVKTVRKRNEAVLEYNSCIQLLSESLSNQEYFEKHIKSLGGQGLRIDRSLPAIVYWLRKIRDSLRLHIMQTLNYQSRAIRYWGLQKNPLLFEPLPLQNYASLSNERVKLREAFSECLQSYATSVRNVWPSKDEQQGLLRQLTAEEIQTLQKNVIHSKQGTDHIAFIRIHPDTDSETFADRIDIRLSQVRLWLLGADLTPDHAGRKLLSIQLIHLGDDLIKDTHNTKFEFSHDPVNIRFDYDVAEVGDDITKARSKSVFSKQKIQDDHYIGETAGKNSIAALGPFTTWKLSIYVNGVNKGLALQGLKEAYLEFRGTSRSRM